MPGSVVEMRVERRTTLNAISLKSAVLCAECDVVSDSPHDQCLVCGSRSLFNISRLFGGTLPKERVRVLHTEIPASLPAAVLTFSRAHRPTRRYQRRFRLKYR